MASSVQFYGYYLPFLLEVPLSQPKLKKEHRRLLELLRQNRWNEDQLAQKSGLSIDEVYRLVSRSPEAGKLGELFNVEYDKIRREIEERISIRTCKVREKLVKSLEQWCDHVAKDGGSNIDTKTKHQMLTNAINAVNKSMPYQVNIEQYNWKEGMSAEEAVREFSRLKGLAHRFAVRSGVQGFTPAGTAQGSVPNGQALEAPEDTQDTILPAKSETTGVPSEQGSGKGDIRRKPLG
jgi:hypothetical protein